MIDIFAMVDVKQDRTENSNPHKGYTH